MAMIHVNRGATSLGVFSEEEVREGLRTGRFRFLRTSGGAKEWQTGSRSRSLQSLGRGRLVRRLRRSAQPRPQKLPPRAAALPWEHRQERGFFNAFVETPGDGAHETGRSIRVMKREGGLG